MSIVLKANVAPSGELIRHMSILFGLPNVDDFRVGEQGYDASRLLHLGTYLEYDKDIVVEWSYGHLRSPWTVSFRYTYEPFGGRGKGEFYGRPENEERARAVIQAQPDAPRVSKLSMNVHSLGYSADLWKKLGEIIQHIEKDGLTFSLEYYHPQLPLVKV
ncbi:MAG: hypothetical protein HYW22_00275 [Candidatus Aenigmarchaeota archaeon]|nr:hypothetical protein [Candidatus Aenigmarchaeota archaeon]